MSEQLSATAGAIDDATSTRMNARRAQRIEPHGFLVEPQLCGMLGELEKVLKGVADAEQAANGVEQLCIDSLLDRSLHPICQR
jgi:hypothetical protein